MAGDPWICDEPSLASVARRVYARAMHRPVRVLLAALLVTGAITGLRWATPPRYEAALFFRLVEGDLTDPINAPRPPRDVREYITSVALSRQQLEQIMRKHRVKSAWLARDRVAAIDSFREDIGIDVSRSYFIYERRASDEPRSAQVAITFAGGDAEQTREVLHDIRDAILRDQDARRRELLAQARELFATELELARARVRTMQERIATIEREADLATGRRALRARAAAAVLHAQAETAIEQVVVVERRAAEVSLSEAAHGERLGLEFELIDEGLATFTPHLTAGQLALRAAMAFPIALLVTALLVGAFDDRIYTPADLASRDLPVLGALGRFTGDDVGAFRARVTVERAAS